MNENQSIEQVSVTGVGTSRRLRHSVCGQTVDAIVDDPHLFDAALHLYGAVAYTGCHPAVAVAVRQVAGGYRVDCGAERSRFCESRNDALVVFEHALTCVLLESCETYAHVHAAGAMIDGRAVLALGGSGTGKSSLALAWDVAGYPTFGDDVVFVDRRGWVHAFPRLFKVSPELVRQVGLEPERTPFWDPSTGEAWYSPEQRSGWARPAPISKVLLCRRVPGESLLVDAMPRVEGLNALLHSRMETGMDTTASFSAMLEATGEAEFLRVSFDSSVDAAGSIAKLVQRPADCGAARRHSPVE